MKKIIFYTVTSDYYKDILWKCQKSLKYFHPDIEHVIMGQAEIDEAMRLIPGLNYGWLYAIFGHILSREYETVVNIDTDNIVLAPLTEVLEGDYEMAAPYNNNPFEPFGAWLPEINPALSPLKYVNVGLHAVRSAEVWEDWINRNKIAMDDPRYHWQEQDTFNEIFHSGTYKTLLLDGERGDYGTPERYYGTAARQQWHMFKREGDQIVLNEKPVKILHHSGGTRNDKLKTETMVSPEVQERINQILA